MGRHDGQTHLSIAAGKGLEQLAKSLGAKIGEDDDVEDDFEDYDGNFFGDSEGYQLAIPGERV